MTGTIHCLLVMFSMHMYFSKLVLLISPVCRLEARFSMIRKEGIRALNWHYDPGYSALGAALADGSRQISAP